VDYSVRRRPNKVAFWSSPSDSLNDGGLATTIYAELLVGSSITLDPCHIWWKIWVLRITKRQAPPLDPSSPSSNKGIPVGATKHRRRQTPAVRGGWLDRPSSSKQWPKYRQSSPFWSSLQAELPTRGLSSLAGPGDKQFDGSPSVELSRHPEHLVPECYGAAPSGKPARTAG
jgi:hypothetical protein